MEKDVIVRRMPQGIWQIVRKVAFLRGITMRVVLTEALTLWLKREGE